MGWEWLIMFFLKKAENQDFGRWLIIIFILPFTLRLKFSFKIADCQFELISSLAWS